MHHFTFYKLFVYSGGKQSNPKPFSLHYSLHLFNKYTNSFHSTSPSCLIKTMVNTTSVRQPKMYGPLLCLALYWSSKFTKCILTHLPQVGFKIRSLGPQAFVLPTEPTLLEYNFFLNQLKYNNSNYFI